MCYNKLGKYNLRKLQNKTRDIAMHEFYPQPRGPFEHQALHHVKGTDLESDQCRLMESRIGE